MKGTAVQARQSGPVSSLKLTKIAACKYQVPPFEISPPIFYPADIALHYANFQTTAAAAFREFYCNHKTLCRR